ncbi:MAG: hypothetical protein MUP70_11140 [Candidatus Aminicenantes bacterium]|nr:hypothetical protein [Candidatus Aminicenantes bacterium]
MNRNILRSVLYLMLSAAVSMSVRGDDPQDSRPTLTPLHKSLIYPGWGQLSEKHVLEGILFMAAETVCLFQVIQNNRNGNLAYVDYKTAASVASAVEQRALTEKYDTRRNQWLLAAAGVWIANLVNIHIIVRNKGKPNDRIQLRMDSVSHKTIAFNLSYRF